MNPEVFRSKDSPTPGDPASLHPESARPEKALVSEPQTAERPGSRNTFEGLLSDVENDVHDAGQALLFSGDQLRLKVMLLRHQKNPRVIWGLKKHEDWAFKATLLRFARGSEPVHLLLATQDGGDDEVHGWVIKRTMDSFWATPLQSNQAKEFLDHCHVPFALGKPRSA